MVLVPYLYRTCTVLVLNKMSHLPVYRSATEIYGFTVRKYSNTQLDLPDTVLSTRTCTGTRTVLVYCICTYLCYGMGTRTVLVLPYSTCICTRTYWTEDRRSTVLDALVHQYSYWDYKYYTASTVCKYSTSTQYSVQVLSTCTIRVERKKERKIDR